MTDVENMRLTDYIMKKGVCEYDSALFYNRLDVK